MTVYQKSNSAANYNYNIFIYDQYEFLEHFHRNYEVVFVMSGELEITVNDKTDTLRENDFAIVFPNQVHSFRTYDNSRAWIGVFSEDYVKEFATMTKGKEGKSLAFKCSDSEIAYLKKEFLTTEPKDILQAKASLYMICSRYLMEIELCNVNVSRQKLAHSIIRYVENNFLEDITLERLAKDLGYEYHYFSRCFKNIFRTSFKTYVNQHRYEYAKNLILKTDHTFITIAHQSGFGSLRNFNRIYREFAGITPKEQRETLKKDADSK